MNTKTQGLKYTRKKVLPVILQNELAECGLTCIAMICQYFGMEIDLFHLRKIANTSIRGTTLYDLVTVCDSLELKSRALRIELEDLRNIKKPAILHWNMNHFVVLKKVEKDFIIIHDPTIGLRKCKWSEVSESFTGIVLEIEPGESFQEIRLKNKLTIFALFKKSSEIFKSLMVLFLLSLIIEIFALIYPLFLQIVTDSVINSGIVDNLIVLSIGFGILVIMQCFTQWMRSLSVIFISNNLSEQFSSNVVKHILKLPLDFFEKRHRGDIQSRFHSIELIQRTISTEFINTVLDGLMILVTLIVMLIYNSFLTMIVCATLVIYSVTRAFSYHHIKKLTESNLNSQAKASSIFLETLTAILPIKSYAKESVRLNYWRNNNILALNSNIQIAKVDAGYQCVNQLLVSLDQIVCICAGVYLINKNIFSIGMLMAFLAYRTQVISKATIFIQKCFDFQLISVHLQRLSDILFQSPEEVPNGLTKIDNINGKFKIKDLSYQYEGCLTPVFKNLNIELNAGEKVAIKGPSGCGKTTLLKVMMGLLQPSSGEIYIDNLSLKQFGLKQFREISASVMQDDVLLSGTILQNICFFEESIDLERVYQCAQIAAIHDTILQMSMGYETLVGDLGSSLSGGQKQRILLARALYKKPKILFLDEATSHLDVENENKINLALKQLSITQVVVAHREETIKMADRIIDVQNIV